MQKSQKYVPTLLAVLDDSRVLHDDRDDDHYDEGPDLKETTNAFASFDILLVGIAHLFQDFPASLSIVCIDEIIVDLAEPYNGDGVQQEVDGCLRRVHDGKAVHHRHEQRHSVNARRET